MNQPPPNSPAPAAPPPAPPASPAPEQRRDRSPSGAYVGAALLIAIGVMALAANLTGTTAWGEAIPAAIGACFLVAYAVTRQYGFLVAGGIITGFGGGVLAASLAGISDNGTYVVLGGGLGFILIYAVDALAGHGGTRWWPVIPGGILLLVAGGMATQNEGVVRLIGTWSPLILVLIGLWMLLARSRPVKR